MCSCHYPRMLCHGFWSQVEYKIICFIIALGLGTYFGGGKCIWYKGCFSNHFSASSLVDPEDLANFWIALFPLQ